jgi:type IV/VI secretion system ImpK/VasF family protein
MKLLEIYEDLFQYICRLNRMAKTQAHPEYTRVRTEVKTLLDDIKRNASAEVPLANQVARMELPILFFVDNLICTGRLKFASQWSGNRLAKERNELAGDERFFDLLDKDLTDTSEEAEERLAVYYVCLGLGFMGMYQGQPEQVRRYLEQVFPRIRRWMDVDPRTRISEEAYRHTDTRALSEPQGNKIALVLVIFVFLSLSALVVCYGLYANASENLRNSITTIEKDAQ